MKSILLIGLGRFGRHMAQKLNELGHEVMAVDHDENRVEAALPFVTNAQIGDTTNEKFLRSLGVEKYDVCIVCIGNDFQSSLETTAFLKELGAKKVVSRASRDVQAKFLLRNGADEIVYPEKQLATWTAIRYSSDSIFDYIDLGGDAAIFELAVPAAWAEKSIGELNIRRKYNVNLLAVKKDGMVDPEISSTTVLHADQTMLLLGRESEIRKNFNL
jgi:trk system potassium uptake protein TrkA